MQNIDNNPEFQDDFSPFNENVIERDYTRPNVTGVIDGNPISEPVIIPPTFEDLNASFQDKANEEFGEEGGATSGRATWGERPVANESMTELDGKEKKQAASAMVEAVLDGYTQLTLFANKLVQIPEKKINKKISEGVINPNVQIPVNNTSLPVRDFLKVYNEEIGSVLAVDDEFKDKVRPVMQRVFMKRNIGMTDEQLLGYYFGVDIITKGAIVVQIRNQNNTLIQSIEELSASYSGGGASSRYEEPKGKQEPQQEPTREYAEPTSTREYAEPEERKSTQPEYEEVEVVEEKKETPRKTAMPEFGNADILAEMEEIAKSEKPKRGRAKK
jgi:hypothetical protein